MLFFTNCNTNVHNGNYHDTVIALEDYEISTITKFLSADGDCHTNFWENKFILDCNIKNSAKISAFKDVVIKVTYFSSTNSIIKTENFTIYKVFVPQSVTKTKLEIKKHEDYFRIEWEAVDAIGIKNQMLNPVYEIEM
jgi:sporulation protein YlmC with PRC-barrel domain